MEPQVKNLKTSKIYTLDNGILDTDTVYLGYPFPEKLRY